VVRCLYLSILPGDEDIARQVEIIPYRLAIEQGAHGQPLEFVRRSKLTPAFATPSKPSVPTVLLRNSISIGGRETTETACLDLALPAAAPRVHT
jgi:hypothetical protein